MFSLWTPGTVWGTQQVHHARGAVQTPGQLLQDWALLQPQAPRSSRLLLMQREGP